MTNSELVKQLTEAHEQFCAIVNGVNQKMSERQPNPGEWSVGEVVHHLVLMESAIRRMCRAMRWGFMSKKLPPELHKPAPLGFVSRRAERVKTSTMFMPLHGRLLDNLLKRLNDERKKTVRFARRVNLDKLRTRFVRHPFIGVLSGEEWLSFLAHHQTRHAKQIEEILARFGQKQAAAKK